MDYTHPIKILYIAASGNIIGGGQISLIGILQRLNQKYFKAIVVSPSSGTQVDVLNSMNIRTEIIHTKSFKKLHFFSFFKSLRKISSLIRQEKIAIVHSNAACSRESFLGALAARINRVPFVFHVRVMDSSWLAERLLVALSSKVIVISDAVARKFSWVKSKGKIVRIYNGVDLQEYSMDKIRADLKDELKISTDTPVITTAGMLVPMKGFGYFIEAASKLVKAYPDLKFIIAGEPVKQFKNYEYQLKSLVDSLHLTGKVLFIGLRRDFSAVLAITDIFVLPTLKEAFGRVLIEAMAMGKPLVATNVGGIPEVVVDGSTGILVPPRDPEAIAGALEVLIKDQEKSREMGITARKRVQDLFNIDENVRNIIKLYNTLK